MVFEVALHSSILRPAAPLMPRPVRSFSECRCRCGNDRRSLGEGFQMRDTDVTDISAKMSLPQLTDVLHALADSHQLLLLKIQSLRMEHMGSETGYVAESSRHVERLQAVEPATSDLFAVTAAERGGDVPGAPDVQIESGLGSNRDAPRERETDSRVITHEPTRPDAPASIPTFVHSRVTNDDAPAQVATSTHVASTVEPATVTGPATPNELSMASEPSPTAQVDAVGATSVDPGYNFFDELDDRLAKLEGDPETGPPEEG